MKQIEKRLSQLEEIQNPKDRPTLKVFTQGTDGRVTGHGLEFKNKAEYDKYAKEQGFHEGDRINSVLFVQFVNSPKEN